MAPHTPRKYQEELLEHAKARNTIICADTGTGKTLVSAALIRHYAVQMATTQTSPPAGSTEPRPKRLFCFLVPTVSLVQQQSAYLEHQLALRVRCFSSEQKIDFWKPAQWRRTVDQSDLMVLTPAALLMMLEHGYVSITEIELIVFDEVHHTKGDHPYRKIMDFYHRQKKQASSKPLPRILGMTASPIHRAADPKAAIKRLETHLDATLVEVKLHKDEYVIACQRPTISYILFDESACTFPGYIERDPHRMDIFLKLLDKKSVKRFNLVRERYGPLAQDIWGLNLLEETCGLDQLLLLTSESPRHKAVLADGLRSSIAKASIDASTCTPKLLHLIEHLQGHQALAAASSIIIFAQQRDHCQVLGKILTLVPALQAFLRPSWLVGHASGVELKGHSAKEQRKVVEGFRSGDINCLVATQVAEEGLDFKACSLVIRFDLPNTVTSLIQSRGRARARNSQLVFFCANYTDDQYKVQKFLRSEDESKMHYGQSQSDYADLVDVDSAEEEDEEDSAILGVYRPCKDNTAQMTASSALRLLHETCQLLPRDEFTAPPKPVYEDLCDLPGAYAQQVILPVMKQLQPHERVVQGQDCSSKKLAKASAAFEAIKQLHKKGALDDHLMPVRELEVAAMTAADGQRVDPLKRQELPRTLDGTFPNPLGSLHGPLFLNSLRITSDGNDRSIGIVCGHSFEQLHSFTLDGTREQASLLAAVPLTWAWASSEYATLERYTRCLVQAVCDRRHTQDTPLWHLMAPLTGSRAGIDWDYVASVLAPQPAACQPESLVWSQMNRRVKPTRIHRIIKTRTDLSLDAPLDTLTDVPMFGLHHQLRKFGSLRQWFTAGLSEDGQPIGRGLCISHLPAEDVLVEVESLQLSSSKRCKPPSTSDASHRGILPLSVCSALGSDMTLFRTVLDSPVICHELISQSMSATALSVLNLQGHIGEERALEALTIPEAAREKDYETLEHVGDAFLKMAATIHIYNEFSDKSEGYMSKVRSNSTDNFALQKLAQQIQLENLLVCLRLGEKSIQLPVFDKDAVPADAHLVQTVRGKAMADVMEALLGAAMMTKGLDSALVVASRLGISVGGTCAWPERYPQLPLPEVSVSFVLAELEKALGHHFKRPQLLLEALRHRSAVSQSLQGQQDEPCYERLEFLGDAVIDVWVTRWLHLFHPSATAGQLSKLRSLFVSNGSLSYLATEKLQLHKYILRNSSALDWRLSDAARRAKAHFENEPYFRAVWFWDPVKVLCDVFESVIGAVLIDSHWDCEAAFSVLEPMLSDIIASVPLDCPPNPWALLEESKPAGCKKLLSTTGSIDAEQPYVHVLTWHDSQIAVGRDESPLIARHKAADVAVHWLDSQRQAGQMLTCDCAVKQLDSQQMDVEYPGLT